MSAEPILTDDLLLIYPRGYGWNSRRRITWKDIAAHPFIALGEHNSTRYLVDHHAAQVGIRLAPAYEVAFVWTAIGLVEAGLGLSLIPGHARPIVQKHPEVAMRPFEQQQIKRPIALLRHRQRTLSPAAQAFAGFAMRFVGREKGIARGG